PTRLPTDLTGPRGARAGVSRMRSSSAAIFDGSTSQYTTCAPRRAQNRLAPPAPQPTSTTTSSGPIGTPRNSSPVSFWYQPAPTASLRPVLRASWKSGSLAALCSHSARLGTRIQVGIMLGSSPVPIEGSVRVGTLRFESNSAHADG